MISKNLSFSLFVHTGFTVSKRPNQVVNTQVTADDLAAIILFFPHFVQNQHSFTFPLVLFEKNISWEQEGH